MKKFRLMLESTLNIKPVEYAGTKSLKEMILAGLTLEKQKLNFNPTNLFLQTTNDEILQKHHLLLEAVTYSAKLIGQIKNIPECSFFPQQISATNLLYATNFSFQNKNKIQKNIPIYIIKYNFKKETKYFFNIMKSFQIDFDEDYSHTEHFLKMFQNNEGLVLPNDNCLFLLLNTTNYTIDTICHQLYHCLQIICEIPINLNELINKELIDIPELNLTVSQLKQYLNPKQLQTYIQIDFINQCKNVFNEYYSNLTIQQNFIINVLKDIKINPFMVKSCQFANCLKYNEKIINRDLTPIIIIAACFLLENKSYLDFITKIIQNEII